MGRRHQGRELALKVLFELESEPEKSSHEVLSWHAEEDGTEPGVVAFAAELVNGVLAHRDEINRLVRSASRNWELDQMAKVDRVILQMAVYEVAFDSRVPVKAAINESIELAKTFSGDESSSFVNGVMGKVVATLAETGA